MGAVDVRADDFGAVALVVVGERPTDDRRLDEDAFGATVRAGDAEDAPTAGDAAVPWVAWAVAIVVEAVVGEPVERSEADLAELQALTEPAMVTRVIIANAPRRGCRAVIPTDPAGRSESAGIS